MTFTYIDPAPAAAKFRFYLGMLRAPGSIIDEFMPTSFNWREIQNGQGDWSTTLVPRSSIIDRVTAEDSEWTYVAYAVQGDKVRWCGVIETPSWSGGRWTLRGPGLWGYYGKRFVDANIVYETGIRAVDLASAALALGDSNGVGLTVIVDPAQFADRIKGTVKKEDHKSVQSIVEYCASLDAGIDFRMEYTIDDAGNIARLLTLAKRIGHRIVGPSPSPAPGDGTLGWDHGKHLTLASYSSDGRAMSNRVYVDGGNSAGDKPAVKVDRSALDTDRPLLERAISLTDQVSASTAGALSLLGDAEVLRVGKVAQGKLILGPDTTLDRWAVGDDVWLKALDTGLDIEGAFRITEATFQVSTDGSVHVPTVVLTDPNLRRPTRRLDGIRELVAYEKRIRALEQIS